LNKEHAAVLKTMNNLFTPTKSLIRHFSKRNNDGCVWLSNYPDICVIYKAYFNTVASYQQSTDVNTADVLHMSDKDG
jgi:hypothetical protein